MKAVLTIAKYPKYLGWAGFLSMAVFHFVLFFKKDISFYRLLGCGKNGTFDIHPDWRQWAVFTVVSANTDTQLPSFIQAWWRMFGCALCTFVLEPVEGHGTWNGKEIFGSLPKNSNFDGPVAVLTRATIRTKKLKRFWSHVENVSNKMLQAEGFILSVGIGEMPWKKQATFSIWQNKTAMKNFAYKMQEHADVVRKTRTEDWYSEDMFVRFRIISATGMLQGKPVHIPA